MNPAVFLPPAAALLIVAVWIGPQRGMIRDTERRNEVLKSRIEAARLTRSAENDPSLAAHIREKDAAADKRIDWLKLAEQQQGQSGGGMPDMRVMVEMQKKLLGMSAEELVAGLDEIAALDLPDEVTQQFESILIGMLAQKEPQLALERFAERVGDDQDGMSWQLSRAFSQWVEKDSSAAITWLDQLIRTGNFDSKSLDGKSQSRLRFEAALMKDLVATDPAAAATRLAALPEDQRQDLFTQGMVFQIAPGSEMAVADLVRSGLPENQRDFTIASLGSQLFHKGGLESVGEFIGQIEASPEERTAIVSQSLSNRMERKPEDAGDIEATRAWIMEQAPDDAERLTGEELGRLASSRDFNAMAEKAIEYQQASGSDDALIAFLSNAPDSNRTEILELAERINDPDRRDEVTSRFLNNPNRGQAIEPNR